MSMLAVRSSDVDDTSDPSLSEKLSTQDICAEIVRLAEAERRTEWLLCRHLAELADRVECGDPELCAYADVYQLARLHFGMSVRRVRERVRMGRALRGLPRIEQAFVDGTLGYAKVREVTRVAEPASEAQWLTAASELPLRVLERRVAEADDSGDGHDRTSDPAAVRWASSASIELRLSLPAVAWALLERAMEGARQKSETSLSDAEALQAVARDALARQSEGQDRADVRHMVVLYACRSCARAEVETGAGPLELSEGAAATMACDAKRCDLETEGRTVSHGGALPAPVRRAVMLRDRMRCRAPGCTGRRYVDVHHLKAREHGGEHSRRNCLVLCGRCHTRVHDGRLRIEGDAEGEVLFYNASGERMGPVAMTPRGHADGGGLSPEAATLLEIMSTSRGWHADGLCAESGLHVSQVCGALLELELSGRVRSEFSGYEAVTS